MPFNRAKNSAAVANPGYQSRHGGLVHFQAAISGNPQKDRGGTALFAGAVVTSGPRPTLTNVLTLATDLFVVSRISGKVIIAGGTPNQSGNLGTINPMGPAAGSFYGKNAKGHYVAMVIGDQIAGSGNTYLRSPAADNVTRKKGFTLTPIYKYQYLSISSWNYETGRATYSGLQGLTVTLPTDSGALLTPAIPGTLDYMYGGPTATRDVYKRRNNW